MSSFSQFARIGRSVAAVGVLTALVPLAHAVGVSGQGTWETTLQGRDLDGNLSNGFEAYYDTVLDVTWLANAGIAKLTWNDAQSLVQNLNVNGVTGWRLPNVTPIKDSGFDYGSSFNGSTDFGYNITSPRNELAHMFYVTLGNKAWRDTSGAVQAGHGLTNTGPFSNLGNGYWSGVGFGINHPDKWLAFYTSDGAQSFNGGGSTEAVWAVHAGDVAAVPEPQTYALWLLGLAALAVARKRQR